LVNNATSTGTISRLRVYFSFKQSLSLPPAKVLVTGTNGYLAVWTVKKYLEAGYSVRGTVRSLSKSAFLEEQFGEYGEHLELVVEDITKDNAFEEAVKGVDAITHTASPFHYNAIDLDGTSDSNRNTCVIGDATAQSSSSPSCEGPRRS